MLTKPCHNWWGHPQSFIYGVFWVFVNSSINCNLYYCYKFFLVYLIIILERTAIECYNLTHITVRIRTFKRVYLGCLWCLTIPRCISLKAIVEGHTPNMSSHMLAGACWIQHSVSGWVCPYIVWLRGVCLYNFPFLGVLPKTWKLSLSLSLSLSPVLLSLF